MQKLSLLLALLCLSVSVSFSQKINYTVDLRTPHTHTFAVSVELSYKNAPDSAVLKMATWTPGSYLLREFAKHVSLYQATNASGDTLESFKVNKNTWVIRNDGGKKVYFNYLVYAHELSVRTTYLDSDLGLINGASLFIYPDGQLKSESKVKFLLPENWHISTTLKKEDKSGNTFSADNYDQLFDCPIFLGTHEEKSFEVSGVKHRIAINGPVLYNFEKMSEDISKIVEAQTSVFGENPNKEYLFIVITRANGGGGLEHSNSTTLIVDRLNLAEERGYRRFLGLVAHEYFHLWNVKRLRARALGPFDYENENYTDLLWVMEGFTSYYGSKSMLKSGFSNEEGYLNRIINTINSEWKRPGAKVQSLAESSLDAWIKFYRGDENDYNATVSYYGKGYLMGALMDMMIIRDTDGEKSLDNLMKLLYERYYKNEDRGFTTNELIAAMNETGGKDYSGFFKRHISGTEFPDVKSILEPFGFKVEITEVESTSFGYSIREEDRHYYVRRITAGSPAQKAGLNVGDEIIAVENQAYSNRTVDFFKGVYQTGDSVDFLIIRDDLVRTISVPIPSGTNKEYRIELKDETSEDEERLLYRFLSKS
jgi:predicted metalloprotease with PDZ domain